MRVRELHWFRKIGERMAATALPPAHIARFAPIYTPLSHLAPFVRLFNE